MEARRAQSWQGVQIAECWSEVPDARRWTWSLVDSHTRDLFAPLQAVHVDLLHARVSHAAYQRVQLWRPDEGNGRTGESCHYF
jgi:hypothetical protein